MHTLELEAYKRQKGLVHRMLNQESPNQQVFRGMNLWVFPHVFPPHADTFLLADSVQVNPGESVLETCAGTGYIALTLAERARSVDAADYNLDAVRNIKKNISLHHLEGKVRARCADLFPKKMYDVIVANPPYSNAPARSVVEMAVWDKEHHTARRLIADAKHHLTPQGRMYVTWANFIDVSFDSLIVASDYTVKEIAQSPPNELGFVYTVHELHLK